VTRPWRTIDAVGTEDGQLELRSRGPGDFHLCLDGRILMNSRASRSEEALGRWAVEALAGCERPRLLLAGLGMGLTLRAVLDALPASAAVVAVELQSQVRDWCEGPLRALCGSAVGDARVEVVIRDVADVIGESDTDFDAIVLDLYEGVRPPSADPRNDPCFGTAALARACVALRPGGVFARWTEQPDPDFERRLARAGFGVERRRVGRGGRRHTLYRARLR